MSPPSRALRPSAGSIATSTILALILLVFSTTSRYPTLLAVSIALGGVAVGLALRELSALDLLRPFAVLPIVAAFTALATSASSTPTTDLIGGLGGLALLLWMAAGPELGPRAIGRSLSMIASTGLVLLIAWTSSLLLPRSPALLGIGGALIVAVVITVALLLGRPDLIDAETPATD